MKVKIGRYKNHWVSPYKIVEKVVFWKDWEKYNNSDEEAVWVEKATDILSPICQWVNTTLDYWFPRKVKVRIDPWDTWNMDHDLSLIILPMLKQLKQNNHGSFSVDDKDVPAELRKTAAPKVEAWEIDDNHFKRYEWVMDEMIWAFEQIANPDYDDAYMEPEFNKKKMFEIEDRINNGTRLFGKYYRGLWD